MYIPCSYKDWNVLALVSKQLKHSSEEEWLIFPPGSGFWVKTEAKWSNMLLCVWSDMHNVYLEYLWMDFTREKNQTFHLFPDYSGDHTIPFKLNYLTNDNSNILLKPADRALSANQKKRKPQSRHQPSSLLCSEALCSPDNNDRKISPPSLPGLRQMLCLSHSICHPQRPLCDNWQGSSEGNPELPTPSLCTSRYCCRGVCYMSQRLWSHWVCSSPSQNSQTASPLCSCPRNGETNGF